MLRGTLDDYQQIRQSSLNGETAIYEELYCLRDDPHETMNRINDLSCQEIANAMRERINEQGVIAMAGVDLPDTVPGTFFNMGEPTDPRRVSKAF